MRISAKGEYAIRAVLDLALHHGRGLIPIQDVARRQGIPQRYLEQVLLLLKRAGFLGSKRGSTGGYRLTRPPEAISVGEVLRTIEGRLTLLEGAGGDSRSRRDADRDLAELWREVAEAVGAVIDRTTFGDLVERARARRSPHRSMYHI
ncbi:MAG: RrF2 family transcriptional regulator [Candidatus Rokuibacteriota bacterium]